MSWGALPYKEIPTNPIFIGGLERSGTSLMRAIIGSHPDVAIYQYDLGLWTRYYLRYKNIDLTKISNAHRLIDDIFSDEKTKACHIDLDPYAIKQRLVGHGHITCGTIFRLFLQEYGKQVGRPR